MASALAEPWANSIQTAGPLDFGSKEARVMSISIDEYRYEEIYPSFKAATDEKEKTARINAAFLNNLADAQIVMTGNEPIAIADIGCGPCDTLVKYLTGVRFEPGFKIRATDYSIAYADERTGEGLARLYAPN